MKEYSGFGSSTDRMAVFSFFLAGPHFLPTRFCSSRPVQEKISKDFQLAITAHRAVVLFKNVNSVNHYLGWSNTIFY